VSDEEQKPISLEDMLCTLYSEVQATRMAVIAMQQEAAKLAVSLQKNTTMLQALSNDMLVLRMQVQTTMAEPRQPAPPTQPPPPDAHEDSPIWDKRPDDANPESIFQTKNPSFRIPNR
jgi:hypothetical protein